MSGDNTLNVIFGEAINQRAITNSSLIQLKEDLFELEFKSSKEGDHF